MHERWVTISAAGVSDRRRLLTTAAVGGSPRSMSTLPATAALFGTDVTSLSQAVVNAHLSSSRLSIRTSVGYQWQHFDDRSDPPGDKYVQMWATALEKLIRCWLRTLTSVGKRWLNRCTKLPSTIHSGRGMSPMTRVWFHTSTLRYLLIRNLIDIFYTKSVEGRPSPKWPILCRVGR